jgi:hypothetical protein
MQKRTLIIAAVVLALVTGYMSGSRKVVRANQGLDNQGPNNKGLDNRGMNNQGMQMSTAVPRSYGRIAAVLPDSIGTGLVFEDAQGTIRFVSVNGMKEGELARYDTTPVHGGIPRAYGHLVSAVVNHGMTGLVFEDESGVIRFVTLAGETEQELKRN